MAPKTRQAQLQTDLNKMAAEQHLEYLRSTQFTEATVQVIASSSTHSDRMILCESL